MAVPSFPPSAPPGPGPRTAPKPRGPPPPATESATGYDFDTPCYDTSTSRWYGNPAAVAIKNPRSWEAQHYREGKYPPAADFLPGNENPEERRTRPPPPPVKTPLPLQPQRKKNPHKIFRHAPSSLVNNQT